MNRIFLFLILGYSTISIAQDQRNLEVDYLTKLYLDVDMVMNKIPAQYRSQVGNSIREEIKKGISIEYKLLTNGKKSSYQLQPKINNSQGIESMILNQLSSQDKGALYKDLDSLSFIKEYDIMGSSYLVKGNLTITNWEILKETKMIAGYAARKAEGVAQDSIRVEAWFSPKIPLKDGPERTFGLPGLVLEVSYDLNGSRYITSMVKIKIRKEEIKFKKIASGKIVSQSEFDQEMKNLEKKIREMHGGGVDTDN